MTRGDTAAASNAEARDDALVAPDIIAFESIRVADPALKPRGISTTYTFTTTDGTSHVFDLTYRFDKDVVPDAPWARGLARVLVAIPSLNWHLFAKTAFYDYPLTDEDAAYLASMARVTAREQYLTRFVGTDANIRPEYRVTPEAFDPSAVDRLAVRVHGRAEASPVAVPPTRPDRFVVLASGGKESLLSYGMLRELGYEVFPTFFNESGRHWFTALTSFRDLSAREPGTRRIWSNTDRLYTGVNRLLPFVRSDFQRAGLDTYPVQLFTFNNYQVASLFVALAEGAGALVMGNEFDEGPWPEVKGVRYWYGIYDQSQEFDRAASAFYRAKGFDVSQFSLVRSVSGFLIQRMLATRYPDLWATQTSCHATHTAREEDGRKDSPEPATIEPCGRCSKCLGVLLFHAAGGMDATRIRYTSAHVDGLSERIANTRLKLDTHEAEHCLALAVARGLAFAGSRNNFEPRDHGEVECLRFDAEFSADDELPEPLASRVHVLLRGEAQGVMRRVDGKWVPVE